MPKEYNTSSRIESQDINLMIAISKKFVGVGSIQYSITLKLTLLRCKLFDYFGSILNNIALKRTRRSRRNRKSFGSILNNIALKPICFSCVCHFGFGSILNNIALKPRKKIQDFVIALLVHSKTSVRVLQQLFFLIISWENKPVGNKT